ncbi:uncharacterized protein LOC119727157 [Patiria miniata]|uniref:TGF-beta family profile domain-containing protein n=1 Tax=Patiria miniata TaxID=46514 RepID=A0A913ZU22_PATMI|nr:uncharacterized protein LOC119727157 [Patiria miniata]
MTVVLFTWLLILTYCTCMGRCTAVSGEKDDLSQESLSGALDIRQDECITSKEPLTRSLLRSPVMTTASTSPPPSSSSTTSQPELSDDEHRTTGAHSSPLRWPGPSPSENVPDSLTVRERAFRIAMLRRQLLDKLGLTDLPPPSNKTFRSLPSAIKKRLIGHQPPQRDLPRYAQPGSKITEVLSYAENYTKQCPDPGFCFRFRLVRDIIGKNIKSVHLWMFLTSSDEINRSPVRRFTVWLLLSGESGIKRKELATKVVSKREGWFHLELPKEMNDWSSLEYRIQLTNAATDSSQNLPHFPAVSLARDELPILTVAIDADKHHQRLRRQSQTCPADSDTCCLHPFQVDLAEVLVGIVEHPSTIFANFCRGSCLRVANFDTVHAKVMRDRALIETDEDLRQDLVPCCVPASYAAAQSMLIRHSNGTLIRREVHEISATSCSCK